jgi:hypothetical protein
MNALDDVAALAADAREHIPPLDAVLPDSPARRDDRALLELAAAYSDRAARAAWGVVLGVPIVATLAFIVLNAELSYWVYGLPARRHLDASSLLALYGDEWHPRIANWLYPLHDDTQLAVGIVAIAAIVAGVLRRRAGLRFARAAATRESLAVGRDLLARLEPWSIALWTTGVVALCAYVATMRVFEVEALGLAPPKLHLLVAPMEYLIDMQRYDSAYARVRDLCIALPLVAIASVWVARKRPRWLSGRHVAHAALAVALIALAAAYQLRYDWGYDQRAAVHDALRSLDTFVGIVALTIATLAFSVQRRK